MLCKTIIGTASAIALAMTLGVAGPVHAQTAKTTPRHSTSQSQSSYIGSDAAMKAALKHSGIPERDTYDMDVDLDTDSGPVHYDVEFKSDGLEYNYEIDAMTGEIINFHTEVDD